VYDYVDGKVDWMAYGLEVEGEDGPFAGQQVRPMATCRWDETIAEARAAASAFPTHHDHHDHERHDHHHDHEHEGHDHHHDHEGHDHGHEGHDHEGHDHDDAHAGAGQARSKDEVVVAVLGPGDLVVGGLSAEVLSHADDGDPVLQVMAPVPSTVRPSVTVDTLTGSNQRRAVVTTSDGRLMGRFDADALADDAEAQIEEILAAVQERFGDEDPTEEQLRSFLHERLVSEGRSPEEADQFLAEMDEED
jgi:hypothetical protein